MAGIDASETALYATGQFHTFDVVTRSDDCEPVIDGRRCFTSWSHRNVRSLSALSCVGVSCDIEAVSSASAQRLRVRASSDGDLLVKATAEVFGGGSQTVSATLHFVSPVRLRTTCSSGACGGPHAIFSGADQEWMFSGETDADAGRQLTPEGWRAIGDVVTLGELPPITQDGESVSLTEQKGVELKLHAAAPGTTVLHVQFSRDRTCDLTVRVADPADARSARFVVALPSISTLAELTRPGGESPSSFDSRLDATADPVLETDVLPVALFDPLGGVVSQRHGNHHERYALLVTLADGTTALADARFLDAPTNWSSLAPSSYAGGDVRFRVDFSTRSQSADFSAHVGTAAAQWSATVSE